MREFEKRLKRVELASGGPEAGPGILHISAVEYRQACEDGSIATFPRCLLWIWPGDRVPANA